MRLILDTVTFMWAISSPQRLSRAAMAALRKETTVREISVVSLTEIAVEQIRGKLTFVKADAMAGVADLRLRVLPYAAEHAFRLFDSFGGEPSAKVGFAGLCVGVAPEYQIHVRDRPGQRPRAVASARRCNNSCWAARACARPLGASR